MVEVNYYRLAPTFLYDGKGGSRLFKTQDEVDQAWKDGWFGPPWLNNVSPPMSQMEWEVKADLLDAVGHDPRYSGLKLKNNMNLDTIMGEILKWEEEKGLVEIEEE